ncbi:MAG: tetratricopeptide repeat protein [Candidatus Dadabacteria bacterium]|nr:MAG: tetratricopeptide repeat protein [Candidatus Dadabacteria bacterium]
MGRVFVRIVTVVAAGCLAAALYVPSLENPLIWDDPVHLELARSAPISELFGHPGGEYRRPLVLLSYRLQAAVGLDDPRSLHAANAALHGLNAALLAALAIRLGAGAMVGVAAALIFAFHPIQTAAVAYVSGRTDLLMLLLTLVSLHLVCGERRALRARLGHREGELPRPSRLGAVRIARATGVAVAIVGAALAKEPGVLAGPLAAGLRVVTYRPAWRKFDPIVAAACVATLVAVVLVTPPAAVATASVDWMTRLRDAGTTVVTFGELLVAPREFHLDRLTAVGPEPLAAVGALVAAAILAAIVWFTRQPTLARFCVFAAALVYVPASNLIPVYPAIASRWVFTPEHFMYAPLAALAPLAAAVAYRFLGGLLGAFGTAGRTVAALSVLVIAASVSALAAREIVARQHQLADAETVYKTTLAHSPSPRACFNLGVLLLDRGLYEEAASVYRRCAQLSPNDPGVYVQLGVALQKLGDPLRARMAYATAVRMAPDNALAWSNFASLEASTGNYDAAREKWARALRLDPGLEPARRGLAKLKQVASAGKHGRTSK